MKLKDIEKRLKRESEGASVPDVYARASKAPLNKLLMDETPAHAFQKSAVTFLLIFVVLLFLTVAVGLSAIWLTPAKTPSTPNCYVSIKVNDDMRIGVLMKGGKNAVSLVEEMRDGVVIEKPYYVKGKRISDFISAKSDDKVLIEIISSDRSVAHEAANTVREELGIAYGDKNVQASYKINFPDTSGALADYLTYCGVEVKSTDTDDLIKYYTELFG